MITIQGCARTDRGKVRPINEDNFCVNRYFKPQEANGDRLIFEGGKEDTLVGVFDGIGGEEHGEVASFIAAKTMARFDSHVPEGDWNLLLNEMNGRINEYAGRNQPCNMGSTAAMVWIRRGIAEICNLGDSRVYYYSGGELNRISKDHTEWQRAIDMNLPGMDLENSGIHKNRLTKYLGIKSPRLNPFIVVDIGLRDGDVFLLCSDGLTSMVSEDEIKSVLACGDCGHIADSLIEKALNKGGRDNITVIALCCREKKSWFERLFG